MRPFYFLLAVSVSLPPSSTLHVEPAAKYNTRNFLTKVCEKGKACEMRMRPYVIISSKEGVSYVKAF